MVKFDLFNRLIVLTVLCSLIALIGVQDINVDFTDIFNNLSKPLVINSWHYIGLIWVIFSTRNKGK